MKIIARFYRTLKREVQLYRTFRKLTHEQIADLRRQTEVIEAAKRKRRKADKPKQSRFELVGRNAWGLPVLVEVAA